MIADLSSKRALVTGAANGLGLATVELFHERGARVMCTDIDEAGVRAVADRLGEGAAAMGCDVTSAADLAAAVEATVSAFGGLDVMVNNAGVEVVKPLMETTEQEFDQLMAINVKGVFLGTQAAVPALVESGGGAIVNMASVAGHGGVPLFAIYCASKGAVVRFSEASAAELKQVGIRVNAVCPAFADTAMVERLIPTLAANIPIPVEDAVKMRQGRLCTADEVAETVAFLASDDASFVTGAHYVLDNALSASCL